MKSIIISLFLLPFFVFGCSDNLFGSDSGSSDCKGDSKCSQIDAENAFRSGDYAKAYSICSTMVAKDSTVSYGYFGMAKASLWERDINPLDMFSLINPGKDTIFIKDTIVTEDEDISIIVDTIPIDIIPFSRETTVTQNRYFQAMKKVEKALKPLDRRDSLQRLYELHGKAYPNANTVSDFCKATELCTDTSSQKFPLSDREYTGEYFGNILFIASMSRGLLDVFDINKNGCIAKKGVIGEDNPGTQSDTAAWKKWGCGNYRYDIGVGLDKDENGDFTFDMGEVLDDMEDDDFQFYIDNPDSLSPEVSTVNSKMDDFVNDMGGVQDMMNSLGIGGDLSGDIDKYKDRIVFYRVGTGIDEDGDGCIDEDILDGQDNDGDGLKNSNARVASTDPKSDIFGVDGLMGFHGMTGKPEDDKPIRMKMSDPDFKPICNDHECNRTAPLIPDEDGYVTVIAFTQKEGYWTTNNADNKLKVAQDTACPPQISLEERKELIGGCWPNYNAEKFVKYWLKRELARGDNKLRVDNSCKECEGIKCLEEAP